MKAKTKTGASLEEEYRSALLDYAEHRREEALGRAYEFGRRAIAERKSLVEIASFHHRELQEMVRKAHGAKRREESLRAGSDFLAETLSSYEMTHRGFQDAMQALRQVNETLEEEIKRIAYAVHDEAGQVLVAVHLALAEMAHDLSGAQQEQLARIEGMLNQVESQLRRYSHELRPTVLDDLGWLPAIRFLADGFAKRANLAICIEATASERLPAPVETALYRVVQEALVNATKHAKATAVWIQAWREDKSLCCSVRDNGVGFSVRAARTKGKPKGLGLMAMRERLNAVGGTLRIGSARGRGTKLVIRLPLENPNGDSHRARR